MLEKYMEIQSGGVKVQSATKTEGAMGARLFPSATHIPILHPFEQSLLQRNQRQTLPHSDVNPNGSPRSVSRYLQRATGIGLSSLFLQTLCE